MPFESLDQKRAQLAEQKVKTPPSEKYRSIVRNFPAMVQSMGIGQAIAFLMAKKEDEGHRELLNHITEWLFKENAVPWKSDPPPNAKEEEKLLQRLLAHESKVWWVAEREAVEFSIWLKRFAEARTPPKSTQAPKEE